MRQSARLTALTLLLGGCASNVPQPPPSEAEAAVVVAEPRPSEPPAQPAMPPPSSPRPAREVRIDNSSIESFRASWERLRASLSPEQRVDLNNAVVRLAFAPYGGAANMPGNLRSSAIVPEMIRDRIDGMTFAEITALSR